MCLERLGSNVEQCIFASHHILECAQLLIELCAIFQFSPYFFLFVCWPIAFRIRAISNYFIFNRTPLIFWCQSLRMFINVFILTVKKHNEAYFVRLSFWFCQCFKISCCITFKIHNALCINILLFYFFSFFFSFLCLRLVSAFWIFVSEGILRTSINIFDLIIPEKFENFYCLDNKILCVKEWI